MMVVGDETNAAEVKPPAIDEAGDHHETAQDSSSSGPKSALHGFATLAAAALSPNPRAANEKYMGETTSSTTDAPTTATNEIKQVPPSFAATATTASVPVQPPVRPTTTTVLAKRGVPHVYRDFVNVPDALGMLRKKTGGVTQPFPEKLHDMLDAQEETSIVGWLPHGRAFIVRKPKEFTTIIMPKYFRQTKLTSFQRQLNLYGFRRLTQGADAGAYYHELFLQGRPLLSLRMQRQKVKGTGHKQPADAKTEPNFYAMPPSTGLPRAQQHQPVQQTMLQAELLGHPPLVPLPIAPNPGAVGPWTDFNPGAVTDDVAPPYPHAMAGAVGAAPVSAAVASSQGYRGRDLSPGLRGLHSAANLLKGMAAGLPAATLESPFSLGQLSQTGPAPQIPNGFRPTNPPTAAAASSTTAGSPPSRSSARRSASMMAQFFVPTERSPSLLARVTHIDEQARGNVPTLQDSGPEQSAFFWPPQRQQEPVAVQAAPPPTTTLVIESGQIKTDAAIASSTIASASGSAAAEATGEASERKADDMQVSDTTARQTTEAVVTVAAPSRNGLSSHPMKSISREDAFVSNKVEKGIETEEV